ncbi:MAG: hypothetical protein M3Y03_05990 [Verrucomicrobiota bacterium]|nr:hypothetical protein [Verrucomicrobiota bacterium]
MNILRSSGLILLSAVLALGLTGCAGTESSLGLTTSQGPRPGNSLDQRDQFAAVNAKTR